MLSELNKTKLTVLSATAWCCVSGHVEETDAESRERRVIILVELLPYETILALLRLGVQHRNSVNEHRRRINEFLEQVQDESSPDQAAAQ